MQQQRRSGAAAPRSLPDEALALTDAENSREQISRTSLWDLLTAVHTGKTISKKQQTDAHCLLFYCTRLSLWKKDNPSATTMKPDSEMEQMTGIEPAYSAWEADTLPLSYICIGTLIL